MIPYECNLFNEAAPIHLINIFGSLSTKHRIDLIKNKLSNHQESEPGIFSLEDPSRYHFAIYFHAFLV